MVAFPLHYETLNCTLYNESIRYEQKLDGQADKHGRRLSRPAGIFSFDMAQPSC